MAGGRTGVPELAPCVVRRRVHILGRTGQAIYGRAICVEFDPPCCAGIRTGGARRRRGGVAVRAGGGDGRRGERGVGSGGTGDESRDHGADDGAGGGGGGRDAAGDQRRSRGDDAAGRGDGAELQGGEHRLGARRVVGGGGVHRRQ